MLKATEIPWAGHEAHEFARIGDGRYQFVVPEFSTDFDIDQVRRERYELQAELTVHCGLAGVKTLDRILFIASTNLSNIRDRYALARSLAARTSTAIKAADWTAVIDELSTRVHAAERIGPGVLNLRDVPRPADDQFYRIGRLLVPKTHASLFFGDGDALKTYTGDYLLLELRRQGVRVAIADWELDAGEHGKRFDRLLVEGDAAPDVLYLPCSRPLMFEVDRIARAIREHQIEYLMLDSATPACHGRPEDAEIASAYFRALRSFGVGSLTIAHANRSDTSDLKPFGSVFWFNLARAIWYVRRAEAVQDGATEIGLYPRKFNLGAPQRPMALRFTFTDRATRVTSIDIAEVDSLASKLPLKDRISHVLRGKPRSLEDIAAAIPDSDAETIGRTIRRYASPTAKIRLFTKLPDERFALLERGCRERTGVRTRRHTPPLKGGCVRREVSGPDRCPAHARPYDGPAGAEHVNAVGERCDGGPAWSTSSTSSTVTQTPTPRNIESRLSCCATDSSNGACCLGIESD